MLVLFTTLEIILQCFPKDGPGLLQPALQQLIATTLAGEEGSLTVTSECDMWNATEYAVNCMLQRWRPACTCVLCRAIAHQALMHYTLNKDFVVCTCFTVMHVK